jgi:hypothetical protein
MEQKEKEQKHNHQNQHETKCETKKRKYSNIHVVVDHDTYTNDIKETYDESFGFLFDTDIPMRSTPPIHSNRIKKHKPIDSNRVKRHDDEYYEIEVAMEKIFDKLFDDEIDDAERGRREYRERLRNSENEAIKTQIVKLQSKLKELEQQIQAQHHEATETKLEYQEADQHHQHRGFVLTQNIQLLNGQIQDLNQLISILKKQQREHENKHREYQRQQIGYERKEREYQQKQNEYEQKEAEQKIDPYDDRICKICTDRISDYCLECHPRHSFCDSCAASLVLSTLTDESFFDIPVRCPYCREEDVCFREV